MNGKRAKKLRKLVYGEDESYLFRKYRKHDNGQIVADPKRKAYQRLKKEY